MKKSWLLLFIGITFLSQTFAEDLLEVYHQALLNDPTFQSARAKQLSTNEIFPQSFANLLPNVSATANTTGNHDIITTQGTANSTNVRYNSNGYALTLTQPIFNFAYWIQLHSASATVKQSNATYAAAAQDLMLRVANAYFNVLLAKDNLRFTQAQKEATAKQLEQAKQRFKVGVEAITTVYDAQASYDLVVAQEIAAQNNLTNSREELHQITGITYPQLASLSKTLPLVTPQPAEVAQWVTTAENQNLNLLAARYAADAARDTIKTNFAGHLPQLNAIGNYQKANGYIPTLGANTQKTANIGLQVTIPLFQGGLVVSQTRQAQYDYQKATADMEVIHRDVIAKTRENYNNVLAGISKIKADRQAIKSNQSSFDSTQEAFKVGTRTIVDVLIAIQNLLQAQKNYSQDQYNYLLSTLSLKQSAGSLNEEDLRLINSWLTQKNSAKAFIPEAKPLHASHPAAANKTVQTIAKASAEKKYTIQLMATINKKELDQFIKNHQLARKTTIYRSNKQGQTWLVLVQGEYDSATSAQQAIDQLPKHLQTLKPWVRQINTLEEIT